MGKCREQELSPCRGGMRRRKSQLRHFTGADRAPVREVTMLEVEQELLRGRAGGRCSARVRTTEVEAGRKEHVLMLLCCWAPW